MVALPNAPLVVTTGSEDADPDNAVLSLREALAIAAGTPGADTITFAEGVSTVALTSAGGGALIIASGQDVTIDGDLNDDGLADVTISGSDETHHFTVANGATATLSGLVLTDGAGTGAARAQSPNGGTGAAGGQGSRGDYGGGKGGTGNAGAPGDGGLAGDQGGVGAGSIVNAGDLTLAQMSFVDNIGRGGIGGRGGTGGAAGVGGRGGTGGVGDYDYRTGDYTTPGGDGGTGGVGGLGGTGGVGGAGGNGAGAVFNAFNGRLTIVDSGFFGNIGYGGTGGIGGTGGAGGTGGTGGSGGAGSRPGNIGGGGRGGDGVTGANGGLGGEASGAIINDGVLVTGGSVAAGGNAGVAGAGGGGGANGGGGGRGVGSPLGTPGNAGGGSASSGSGGTVSNDLGAAAAGVVYLSAPSLDVAEGDSGVTTLTFYITRMGGAQADTTVDWTLVGAGGFDAADLVDGQAFAGTEIFTAGGPDTIAVTIAVKGDTAFEADESFTIDLSNLSNTADYALGTSSLAGSALNDDPVSIVYADATRTSLVSTQFAPAAALAVLGALADGQAVDILAPEAFPASPTTIAISANDVTITANGPFARAFELADGVTSITLGGSAELDVVGNAAGNLIKGNDGSNELLGRGGDDRLEGGAGDDTLNGGAGADSMLGGAGVDTVSYATAVDGGVQVSLAGAIGSGDAEGDRFSFVENLLGSALDDVMSGNAGKNVLDGSDGSDILDGADNNDILLGGAGKDMLIGGAGSDTLLGGDGDDVLAGGSSGDLLYGGAGVDTADYSASTGVRAYLDRNNSGTGDAAGDGYSFIENLRGSLTGNDSLYGNAGNNKLEGQGGNDSLEGGEGADILDGGAGADTLKGGGGADRLLGGEGVDSLKGGGGADRLEGGDGDDVLIGGAGADALIGGLGIDTADYDDPFANPGPVNVALDQSFAGTGDAAGDTFLSIENLKGTNGSDGLRGNAASNRIEGRNGNDTIDGAVGNDFLDGGDGSDSLTGGDGNDSFVFTTSPNADVDVITDFVVADDTIRLGDAVFAGLAKTGVFLAARSLTIGEAATTADHRVIYDSATGGLFYDADGTGATAAVQFAQLATGLTMTNQDFIIMSQDIIWS